MRKPEGSTNSRLGCSHPPRRASTAPDRARWPSCDAVLAHAGGHEPASRCDRRIARQRIEKRVHVGPARVQILREAALDGGIDPSRYFRARFHRPRQRETEGVLVGLRGQGPTTALLGRHVERRSHAFAGAREADLQDAGLAGRLGLSVVFVARARQSEIDDDHALGADDDIVRLEISVHDAGSMGGHQPPPGREKRLEHLAPPALLGAEPIGQRRPLHELHGDERLSALRVDIENRDDIWMLQPSQRSRFAQELKVRPCHRCALRADELDGDGAAERRIDSRKHAAHSSGADEAADGVASHAIASTDVGRSWFADDHGWSVGRLLACQLVDGYRTSEIAVARPHLPSSLAAVILETPRSARSCKKYC
jgi:hypothetical protein